MKKDLSKETHIHGNKVHAGKQKTDSKRIKMKTKYQPISLSQDLLKILLNIKIAFTKTYLRSKIKNNYLNFNTLKITITLIQLKIIMCPKYQKLHKQYVWENHEFRCNRDCKKI